MSGMIIGARMKSMFFDRARVKNAMDTASYHALLRFGQYVRGSAKGILRHGRSNWGRAPKSPSDHPTAWYRGGLLGKFLAYAYDPGGGVVIGPELVTGRGMGTEPHAGVTIPELLEEGGRVRMTRASAARLMALRPTMGALITGVRPHAGMIVTYRPMPYMGPAFEAGREKLKEFYQDAMEKYAHAA